MKPEVLLAVDQDFGINATIRYAWNGGTFQTFFLSFSSHSFGWCPHFRVRCPVSSCSLSPPCWQCSRFFDSHPLSSSRSLMARCFGATGWFGTFFPAPSASNFWKKIWYSDSAGFDASWVRIICKSDDWLIFYWITKWRISTEWDRVTHRLFATLSLGISYSNFVLVFIIYSTIFTVNFIWKWQFVDFKSNLIWINQIWATVVVGWVGSLAVLDLSNLNFETKICRRIQHSLVYFETKFHSNTTIRWFYIEFNSPAPHTTPFSFIQSEKLKLIELNFPLQWVASTSTSTLIRSTGRWR